MKYQQFKEDYPNYRLKNLQSTFDSLTFDYEDQSKKELIAEALCLWQYMRSYVLDYESSIAIYNEMKNDSNPHIAVVVAVESLPEKVWRKLLWRENIDFLSFESFLRRLEYPQRQSIMQSAEDLHGSKPQVPKVFRKRFIDFLLVLFGIITVKKLLEEDQSSGVSRYVSKAAWAFNLLGIDFGFSLYPSGINDDTKITNKKWTRFLSIKEHINDFVVNQEDGVYWWMYRSTRSFLTFRFTREVELKKHVCPGFWATLIFQIYFWIVSPVGFIVLFPSLFVANQNFKSTLLVLCAYTPFYLAILTIIVAAYLIGEGISKIFKLAAPGLSKSLKEIGNKKWFKVTTGFLSLNIVTILVILVSSGIISLVYRFHPYVREAIIQYYSVMELYLKSGMLQTTLLTIWIPIEIVRLILRKNESSKFWVGFSALVFGMFIINVLDSYVTKLAFAWTYQWLSEYFPVLAGVVLLCLPLMLAFFFIASRGFEPEKYSKMDNFILWFTRVWIIGMICGFIYFLFFTVKQSFEYDFFTESKPLFITLIIFALVATLSMFQRTKKINKNTVKDFMACRSRVKRTYNALYLGGYILFDSDISGDIYLKNRAIIKMSDEAFNYFLHRLEEAYRRFALRPGFEIADLALLNVRKDGHLKNSFRSIDSGLLAKMSEFQRHYIFCEMLKGRPFIKVRKEAEVIYAKIDKAKTQTKKTWGKVATFFRIAWQVIIFVPVMLGKLIMYIGKKILSFLKFISRPFVWAGTKIWNYIMTLKDLWDLFNNRCPEVSKGKDLSYND